MFIRIVESFSHGFFSLSRRLRFIKIPSTKISDSACLMDCTKGEFTSIVSVKEDQLIFLDYSRLSIGSFKYIFVKFL